MLYSESRDWGNPHREEQFIELKRIIELKREEADSLRSSYMKPDFSSMAGYERSMESYRTNFINMLGWPLNEYHENLPIPDAQVEFVAEDDLGKIYRLHIKAMEGVTTYGILFLPNSSPPHSLVIAQHGGLGTPELVSDFFGSGNYNDMTRRVLRQGLAVFAPQLLLWDEEFGPETQRQQIDVQLKQLGGSITAFEIFKLKRCIDYLAARADINADQIGMIGLSYGGFYTLFTAAADLRIKAALTSCFFNNRFVYDWADWTWFNSGNTFMDAEICALICPRPLYIEVGTKDELFDVQYAAQEFNKAAEFYRQLNCLDRLAYKEFDGGHELNKEDRGILFLCESIMK